MSPKRIQMSRQHPWRADNPTAIVVDRRSKYGNPFRFRQRIGGLVHHPPGRPAEWDYEPRISAPGQRHDYHNADNTITRYVIRWATLPEIVLMYRQTITSPTPGMIDAYPSHGGHLARVTLDEIISDLRGSDLACWCPLDQPCHADVLLEFANA